MSVRPLARVRVPKTRARKRCDGRDDVEYDVSAEGKSARRRDQPQTDRCSSSSFSSGNVVVNRQYEFQLPPRHHRSQESLVTAKRIKVTFSEDILCSKSAVSNCSKSKVRNRKRGPKSATLIIGGETRFSAGSKFWRARRRVDQVHKHFEEGGRGEGKGRQVQRTYRKTRGVRTGGQNGSLI